MKKLNILLAITFLTFGLSCSDKPTTSNETTDQPAEVTETTKQGVITDYMALKDAFVQTAVDAAKEAASKLVESLKEEDMDEVTINAASMIMISDDVEEQRAAFKTLTDNMVAKIKSGDKEAGVYVQYCPMAFDNEGAIWMSLSEEIRNPYFGDKMLKCGKVQEKL